MDSIVEALDSWVKARGRMGMRGGLELSPVRLRWIRGGRFPDSFENGADEMRATRSGRARSAQLPAERDVMEVSFEEERRITVGSYRVGDNHDKKDTLVAADSSILLLTLWVSGDRYD